MNWLRQTVGIEEPIYGSSALHPVSKQSAPWTELKREDLQWQAPTSTCVETQTFYVMTDSGHIAMAQVIYNCLAGIRTTLQFNCKIFYPGNEQKPLWTSDTLEAWRFDDSKNSFMAKNCTIDLGEDGSTFRIKSSTNSQAIVDLKFTRTAPGFMAGKDGTTLYGKDPAQPWGRMLHKIWPRCQVEGSIITQAGEVPAKGIGMFLHALQGIKPNFAASAWNFIGFQSPTHSAIMMEFTTPPSYGSTKVTIGGIAQDGKIVHASGQDPVQHTSTQVDPETEWSAPESAKFEWKADGKTLATISGSILPRADRVDVLAQIPSFLKMIIAQAANTKPFIYQYTPKTTLDLTSESGEVQKVEGRAFMEATFIS